MNLRSYFVSLKVNVYYLFFDLTLLVQLKENVQSIRTKLLDLTSDLTLGLTLDVTLNATMIF
jgi:hypothetical protein